MTAPAYATAKWARVLLAGECRSNITIGIQLINVGKIPGINEPLLLGEGDDLVEVLVLTIQRVVLGNPIGLGIRQNLFATTLIALLGFLAARTSGVICPTPIDIIREMALADLPDISQLQHIVEIWDEELLHRLAFVGYVPIGSIDLQPPFSDILE
ncbi:hypothetical protein H261_20909 [Paramagnetospirillum caucaseum]|uniref:Uncharacterized protein n=1 Tax=Paramagnetospirillum caucaseum TaxID=1244869 RepID=M2Z0Y4_9PROT|nr:hypothetical protein H261_20909 [Paramagnetospirillum caucaseum]